MLPTLTFLQQQIQEAIAEACGVPDADPLLVPASNPKFGDYQANACLPLAKTLQISPRELALRVAEHLSIADVCEPPTVAGPGFINLTLTRSHLETLLQKMHGDARLGVAMTAAPRRAVVDFSSPNVAKDMHVGHLRSTILGDCLARVLEFLGHDVLRINHVGDWGTQFGMLITFLQDAFPAALTTADALDLGDLVKLYRQAKLRFDDDADFRERSREQVVRLQVGEPDALHAWKLLCQQSRRAFEQIYALLEVEITERGESFYNPLLPAVVQDLQQAALLAESNGALCVFVAGFTNREGEPQALIIRKSDGGYNYATTDLAALRYRIGTDHRDWLIYVVDSGQAAHFAQVFAVAEEAGWVPAGVTLTHVPFGLVLGEDGKRLKTRSGENVRLLELLNEAVAHARRDFEARLLEEGRDEPEAYKAEIARVLGIGAVKYADLSHNRLSDYAFQLEKMLALTGNTAPYLIYAYVRVQGISRKISGSVAAEGTGTVQLQEEAEISLAKHLVQLDVVLAAVAGDFLPSRLCQHLFELSQKFNVFYENCPVLSAEPALRQSRLMLCTLTAQTLKLGLSLLGLSVVERM